VASVDIYMTSTKHYRIDLDQCELLHEAVYDESPEFYVDDEPVEGGIADYAYSILRDLLVSRDHSV
jgi:hypothetical protein